jgi:hypothetical protein
MSAHAEVLRASELMGSRAQETTLPRVGFDRETNDWNPEDFAREQIRGLVQRVFFASGSRPVRQVVFSAVEPNTDVANLCVQVGQALALETRAHVAIVGREQRVEEITQAHLRSADSAGIKVRSTQTAINLWQVAGCGLRTCSGESGTGPYWLSCLAELRSEFEYAVIHGPVAGMSSEAALLGQLADGIILVLGAHSTRKATARKIKETLEGAQSRILGTVLSQRRFPVPERIYRRL